MLHSLELVNLHAGISDKEIIKGINLKVKTGEIHVIMGPNGAGKSTLTNNIIGNPKNIINSGDKRFTS